MTRLGSTVRIGTRGSPLALAQSGWLKRSLEARWPEQRFDLTVIVTSGDRVRGNLATLGGKGLFVKEIEEAVYEGRVDLAVHSMKDLPAVIPEGLVLGAVPSREDPRDVLVGAGDVAKSGGDAVLDLPAGARVGTTSLRRRAQLLATRPDLEVLSLRGNVDTRLRKRAEGVCDAVVLAAAGLIRLSIGIGAGTPLDPDRFVPAVGQGALALEMRAGDGRVADLLAPVNDAAAWNAVKTERAFLTALGGDCVTPIGGHAIIDGDAIRLTGLVATPDGSEVLRDTVTGGAASPEIIGRQLASLLQERGADAILARVRRETA